MPWLNGNDEITPDPRFSRNTAGRPLIPDLKQQIALSEEAPHDLKLLAITWAREWLGITGSIDQELAVSDLDIALSGRRRDHTSDEGRILQMAGKALYHWREAAAHERTQRAFPWLRFVAIDGQPNCCEANALNGQLLENGRQPLLPLPSCDASRCGCIYIQITEGRRRRMIEQDER